MSENKNINTVEQTNTENKPLTAREVWEQIIKLQEQLLSIQDASVAVCNVHSIDAEYEDGEMVTSYDAGVSTLKLDTIREMFKMRETTVQTMLSYYYEMFKKLNS